MNIRLRCEFGVMVITENTKSEEMRIMVGFRQFFDGDFVC